MNMKQSVIAILCFFWAASTCVFADITYTTYLSGADSSIASQVEASIAEAVGLYNQYGSFNKHLNIYYDPSVPTADGNWNGNIRFGGQRTPRVALHEISHTLGVGTYGTWWNFLSGVAGGHVWLGGYAIGQVEEFDGPGSVIYAEGFHFWLYGLNYETEDNFVDRIRHIRMVANIACDMGLVSFAREPEPQAVQLGGTATFNVVAANATSYAWYKEGDSIALTDGENVSGATTDILEIANVDARDDGYYYCVASGTLASRVGRLTVEHSELYDRSDFTIDDIRGSDPYEAGNKFVTGSNPPTITALGFIDLNNSNPATDPDGDGLLESHRVTLWSDSDGSKVTEVTVPAGTAGHLIDGFRYTEIPEGAITLAPNTAYVVSTDIAVLDPWLNEEYLIPNADFIDENVDDSTTWEGRWGTQGQWPTSQWHTGTFYGLVNVTTKIILRADYDGSGIVDLYDLEILSQNWLQDAPVYDSAPQGGDGMIDLLEFQILAEEWLR
jgi:hypothetical protein